MVETRDDTATEADAGELELTEVETPMTEVNEATGADDDPEDEKTEVVGVTSVSPVPDEIQLAPFG